MENISTTIVKGGRTVSVFLWKGTMSDGREVVFQQFDSSVNYNRYPNFLLTLNEIRKTLFPNLPFNSGVHEFPSDPSVTITIVRINAVTGTYSPTELKTPAQAKQLMEQKHKRYNSRVSLSNSVNVPNASIIKKD